MGSKEETTKAILMVPQSLSPRNTQIGRVDILKDSSVQHPLGSEKVEL